MTRNYENIPDELKKIHSWVAVRIVKQGDRVNKLPINPITNKGASTTDPSTWCSFEEAVNSGYDAIGFVFNNNYIGIDIDHNEEVANDFLNHIDTYCEKSVSGNGYHFIGRGIKPNNKCRKDSVEVYTTGRFFVMTGNVVKNTSINDITDSLKPLFLKYIGEEKSTPDHPLVIHNISLTDQELIDKAKNSKNSDLFNKLYSGNWQDLYESQNRADTALMNMLAFWTNCNREQMDRIFRSSGLYREKYDSKRADSTYGKNLIENCIAHCDTTYNPKKEIVEYWKPTDKVVYDENGEIIEDNKFVVKDDEPNIVYLKKYYPINDTGNAQLFVDLEEGTIKYNFDNDIWMIWNDKKWQSDTTDQIRIVFNDLITYHKKLKQTITTNDDEEDEEIETLLKIETKNISKISSYAGKSNVLNEAKSLVPCLNSEFNKNAYILNTDSGIVDLKTGEILPHNKEEMCSKSTNIKVDFSKSEIWENYIDFICSSNEEKKAFLKRAIGYSVFGHQKEKCAFICVGEGDRGKSLFLGVLKNVLGDYAENVDIKSFMAMGGKNENLDDIARLDGIRFVVTSENNSNKRSKLDESLFKQITSDLTNIVARYRFGHPFSFNPCSTIWIDTNYDLDFNGLDNAIWNRYVKITFDHVVVNKDKNLKEKLLKDKEKILGWIIEGAIEYNKLGDLKIPEEIKEDIEETKKESNLISMFIQDELEEDITSELEAKKLYKEFVKYCEDNQARGVIPSNVDFGKQIGAKYTKKRRSNGNYYIGIRLKNDLTSLWDKE